ncbi:transcriptional regulator Kaiso [Arapaima gigas]
MGPPETRTPECGCVGCEGSGAERRRVLLSADTLERAESGDTRPGFAGMTSVKLITATDALYSGSLLKSISEQRNAGLFCDVTIIVQDRKFRAHKNVLSASSFYFHQLFSAAGQVIELNFVKAEIFEEILNYIYSSKLVRVRSDKLKELIQAGQTLGVKFIANLGVLLSQVRGLPGLSKVPDEADAAGAQNDTLAPAAGPLCAPIVTEDFSLSVEDFDSTDDSAGKEGNLNAQDVLFVSKHEPQPAANPCGPATHGPEHPEVSGINSPPVEKDLVSREKGNMTPEAGLPFAKGDGGLGCKDGKPSTPNTEESKPLVHCSPTQSQLGPGLLPTPLASPLGSPLASPLVTPDITTSIPQPLLGPSAFGTLCSAPATPAHMDSAHLQSLNSPHPRELGPLTNDVLGVHKQQVTTPVGKLPGQPGDFKIKLQEMRSGKNGPGLHSPKTVGKKTITLDKASEIDSLSTGCKVYANIGENTYDIVPMKEDPGEGDSKASRARKSHMSSTFSPDTSPQLPRGVSSKKKAKVEQDDHYELVMDGKTFYVCVVCKRPYVCLTSLRRHFNTHSWEKKYPCHYCDKVFALAEYRTKHEIYHTGERRYQCLLCNEFFINYQLLSSHCKQVHNQDPSGRKEKDDTDNNLYRLLPCKTLQFKPYSYISESSGGIPVINEEGIVYHMDPGKGPEIPHNPTGAHIQVGTHLPTGVHLPTGPHPPTGAHPNSSQSKVLNWDEMFVEPGAQAPPQPPGQPQTPATVQPHPLVQTQAPGPAQPQPPAPAQPHPLVQTQPPAPAQPHPLVQTQPPAPAQPHPLVQTQPPAPAQPQPLVQPQPPASVQLQPLVQSQEQPLPQPQPTVQPQPQPQTPANPAEVSSDFKFVIPETY